MHISQLLSWFSKSLPLREYPTECEEDNNFVIRNQREIIYILNELKRNKTLLNLSTTDRNYLRSFIVDIHPESGDVIIDFFTKIEKKHPTLSENMIIAISNHKGIECSFIIEKLNSVNFKSETAFSFKRPLSINWMQKRTLLRTPIPISHHGSYCEFRLPRLNGKFAKLSLYDLHSHGFSMVNTDQALRSCFEVNDDLTGHIYLQIGICGYIQFTIKHINNLSHDKQCLKQIIGCELVDSSAEFEAKIQYYIQFLQLHQANN